MNSSISLAGAIALVEAQAVKMVGALYALRFGWKSSSSTATAENHATIDALPRIPKTTPVSLHEPIKNWWILLRRPPPPPLGGIERRRTYLWLLPPRYLLISAVQDTVGTWIPVSPNVLLFLSGPEVILGPSFQLFFWIGLA
jgi:hypothetical protein